MQANPTRRFQGRVFLQNGPEQGVLSSIHLRPYHSTWLMLGPRDHVQISAKSFRVTALALTLNYAFG